MVTEVVDPSAYRVAVDVNIHRRHENRYLYPLVVEVLCLFGLFNHHHFSVRRTKYGVFIGNNASTGAPEKLQNGDKQQERKEISCPYHERIARRKVMD